MLWIFACLASPALADVTGPGGKVIDCYCTDSTGGRVELGEEICLFVDGRAFIARCEMSLNNPIWRHRALLHLKHPDPPPQGARASARRGRR